MGAIKMLVLNFALAYSIISVAMAARSIGGWELTHFDIQTRPENKFWSSILTTDSTNIAIKFKLVSQTPEVPEFTLDEKTGKLLSMASFDYETHNKYVLLIRAENRNDALDFNERNLTINVLNLNEPPAFGVKIIRKQFLENKVVGTKLVKVNATDPEGNDITYSLELEKHFAGMFLIDEKTGWIIANTTLKVKDTQYNNDYRFQAVATDNGTDYNGLLNPKNATVVIDILMANSVTMVTGNVFALLSAFVLINVGE